MSKKSTTLSPGMTFVNTDSHTTTQISTSKEPILKTCLNSTQFSSIKKDSPTILALLNTYHSNSTVQPLKSVKPNLDAELLHVKETVKFVTKTLNSLPPVTNAYQNVPTLTPKSKTLTVHSSAKRKISSSPSTLLELTQSKSDQKESD